MGAAADQSVTVRHDRRASLARINPSDLRSFNANPRHQAFLIEDKRISIILERRGRQVLGNALIDDHNGWANANLPAIRSFQITDRILIHQKHGVPV
eukprot:CAMPEP_0184466386 /NCGR_PEP_ID=MMETSP0740-20130409/65911_1 /TAXON_ID=385413 /ORGANISM="Thalassiosira miniscula, Strain CCMP1093" /LENGTH=96 /DNA_ID=CAMNT_0026841449 /DNA_START=195 /DNA_END=485 /DNA_ORIENTATION=-